MEFQVGLQQLVPVSDCCSYSLFQSVVSRIGSTAVSQKSTFKDLTQSGLHADSPENVVL